MKNFDAELSAELSTSGKNLFQKIMTTATILHDQYAPVA